MKIREPILLEVLFFSSGEKLEEQQILPTAKCIY